VTGTLAHTDLVNDEVVAGAARMCRWTDVGANLWHRVADSPADGQLLEASGYVPERSLDLARCACGRPAAAWISLDDGSRVPVCVAVIAGRVDAPNGLTTPFDPETVVICECRCSECRRVAPGDGSWVRPLPLGDAVLTHDYLACPPCAAQPEAHGWTSHHGPARNGGTHGPVYHAHDHEAVIGSLMTPHGGDAAIGLTEWFELARSVPEVLDWIRDSTGGRRSAVRLGHWWVRHVEWYGSGTLVECECSCGCRRYGTFGALLRGDVFQCDDCAAAEHDRPHRRNLASASPAG